MTVSSGVREVVWRTPPVVWRGVFSVPEKTERRVDRMEQQPDMLIFMSDQQDGRLMGCAGDPIIRTPNLDAFASRGTFFKTAYTSARSVFPGGRGFSPGSIRR